MLRAFIEIGALQCAACDVGDCGQHAQIVLADQVAAGDPKGALNFALCGEGHAGDRLDACEQLRIEDAHFLLDIVAEIGGAGLHHVGEHSNAARGDGPGQRCPDAVGKLGHQLLFRCIEHCHRGPVGGKEQLQLIDDDGQHG